MRAHAGVLPSTHYCLPLNIDTHLITRVCVSDWTRSFRVAVVFHYFLFCICITGHQNDWNAHHDRFSPCRHQLITYAKPMSAVALQLKCILNLLVVIIFFLNKTSALVERKNPFSSLILVLLIHMSELVFSGCC